MIATEYEKNPWPFHDQQWWGLWKVTPFNDSANLVATPTLLKGNVHLTISLQRYAIEGVARVTNSSGMKQKWVNLARRPNYSLNFWWPRCFFNIFPWLFQVFSGIFKNLAISSRFFRFCGNHLVAFTARRMLSRH